MGAFIKAKPAGAKPGLAPARGGPDPLASLYPALFEYMTETAWEDGTVREVSTLMLFAEQGLWKVWLNDRSLGRQAWAAGPSVSEAIDALERSLASDTVDWRVKVPVGGRGAKRS